MHDGRVAGRGRRQCSVAAGSSTRESWSAVATGSRWSHCRSSPAGRAGRSRRRGAPRRTADAERRAKQDVEDHTAPAEERELARTFGAAWRAYRHKVLIPWL